MTKDIQIRYTEEQGLDTAIELLLKTIYDNRFNLEGARVKIWPDMRSNASWIEVVLPYAGEKTLTGVSSVVPITDEEAEKIFNEIADQEEERRED